MILDFITINHTRVGIDCNNVTRSTVTFIIQRNLVFDCSFKKKPGYYVHLVYSRPFFNMRHINCYQTWMFNILKEQMANPEWGNKHEFKLTLCHMTKDVKTRHITSHYVT